MMTFFLIAAMGIFCHGYFRAKYRLKVGENQKRVWHFWCMVADTVMIVGNLLFGSWIGVLVWFAWLLHAIWNWWHNGGDKGIKNFLGKTRDFLVANFTIKPAMQPAIAVK